MAWRLARSLETLRAEVRATHPGTTFWTIGDKAHRGTWSDHNPNSAGVVCAADILGDRGLNLGQFAETVRTSHHPAFKYAIYNRRIAYKGGRWQPYYGSNPHTTHVHVSVGIGPDGRSTGPYDDTSPWGIQENDMPLTTDDVRRIAGADVFDAPKTWMEGRDLPTEKDRHWTLNTYFRSIRDNVIYARRSVESDAAKILAGQTAILAAVGGANLDQIQEAVRAELATAADRERAERAAERDELIGPIAQAVAAAVDHELDTAAVEAAIRTVFGGLDT